METNEFVRNIINATTRGSFRERLAQFGNHPERDSMVSGTICFVFKFRTDESNLEICRNAILAADQLAPWRDNDVYPESNAESISYLSAGEIAYHNWSGPEQMYWFHLGPRPDYLKKSQLLPYRKYLDTLGQSLAQVGLPGVVEVRTFMETRSASKFSC